MDLSWAWAIWKKISEFKNSTLFIFYFYDAVHAVITQK